MAENLELNRDKTEILVKRENIFVKSEQKKN